MTTNDIAHALQGASETEKAQLAQAILDALHQHDLDHDLTKHVIVGALDRFAAQGREGGSL